MENAGRLRGNVMSPGEHEQIFCLHLMFYHCTKSPLPMKKEVDDVRGDLEGGKKKVSEVSEREDKGILSIKSFGSTLATLVEEIFSTRRFSGWGSTSKRKRRRGTRCSR